MFISRIITLPYLDTEGYNLAIANLDSKKDSQTIRYSDAISIFYLTEGNALLIVFNVSLSVNSPLLTSLDSLDRIGTRNLERLFTNLSNVIPSLLKLEEELKEGGVIPDTKLNIQLSEFLGLVKEENKEEALGLTRVDRAYVLHAREQILRDAEEFFVPPIGED